MIKRKLTNRLINHLHKKEITFIVGPRQAGKTTLMKILQEEAIKENVNTLYLNLDIEMDKHHFISQAKFLQKVALEVGQSKAYVFIDEIQRKEDAGLFLKGLYDMNLPYKFIVSGSGSVELKEHIHESLAGRKQTFELSTVTFEEFVNYKTEYKYENRLKDFFYLEKDKVDKLLDEYLNFGGYPRVVLEKAIDEKRRIIAELYQSYLERDITHFLGVQKTAGFSELVKVLASQIGGMVNISELSGTLGLSSITIKNYLWYIERTYVIQKLTPFFKNVRKEITKSPIYYFNDLGLRNYALGIFGNATMMGNIGHLFENFIFNILRDKIKDNSAQLHYWRTKDKAEVDFVLDTGLNVIPIEVKSSNIKDIKITRSYQNFISMYHPSKGYVFHQGDKHAVIKNNDTSIHFLPYNYLFFENLT
ncbi:MAG: ATP-binding protein [bacterium]|nr:ATP-binding protein [bacterium]